MQEIYDGGVIEPRGKEMLIPANPGEVIIPVIENRMAWNAYNGLYICEPEKNTGCKKSNCFKAGGQCYMTTNKEFRKD